MTAELNLTEQVRLQYARIHQVQDLHAKVASEDDDVFLSGEVLIRREGDAESVLLDLVIVSQQEETVPLHFLLSRKLFD